MQGGVIEVRMIRSRRRALQWWMESPVLEEDPPYRIDVWVDKRGSRGIERGKEKRKEGIKTEEMSPKIRDFHLNE